MHAKSIKGEMKMQTKNKAYTTLIIAVLTLSMILAAIPLASANPLAVALRNLTDTGDLTTGPVGTKVLVKVTDTTPGGLVKVYWDSIKDWDGKAGYLGEAYAVGTTATITIVVPAAVKGDHYVIAKDIESSATASATFTVTQTIVLSPSKALAGDTINVKGTGFPSLTSIVVLYKPSGPTSVEEFVGIGDGSRKVFYLANKPVKGGSETITTWTGETTVTAETVTLSGSGVGPYTGNLTHVPVKPASIELTVSAEWGGVSGDVVMTDTNGDGNLESTSNRFNNGTINYATGDIKFTFKSAPDTDPTSASADYKYYHNSSALTYTIDYITGIITFATAPASGAAITAEYDYYSVALQVSASTNDVGNFTATFQVPAAETTGNKLVKALDSKGNEAYATLNIVSCIMALSPTKGYVGSTVTVTGRGFTAGKTVDIRWYIGSQPLTVVDDYPVATDGTFTTTFKVPAVPDPRPPGDIYSVDAVDTAGKIDSTTFTVVAPAKIILSPTSGKVGATVTITGSWFTPDTKVTFTFNGAPLTTIPSPVYTDGDGAFTADFKVPNVAAGTYTVKATDAKGVSATATFKVTVPVVVIQTRATEYLQGDTISIYANCSEPYDAYIEITDPNGVPFYSFVVDDGTSWMEVDGWYTLPYVVSFPLNMMPIPSDAPLGSWNFTAYEATVTPHPGGGLDYSTDKSKILDTNLFTVRERPTLATILDRLDEVNATLSGLITDAEGNLKAYIDTSLGPVTASLNAINATLVSIKNGVATISTTVGEIKVTLQALDLSAINAKLTSIENKVVTISTSIGTVQTTLGDINAKLVSLEGSLATIETDVGTIKTDVAAIKPVVTEIKDGVATVQTDVGVIKGKVETVEGNVATIKTDVGTIKVDISDVKTDVATVPGAISGVTLPIWIAVVLSLIAAIASIYAVITIRRKIAG